ncbi:MAG TPA: hypothetical protein VIS74_03150 [Chthoniobacterales bacterium]
MKTFTQFIRRIRRPRPTFYQQLELPLRGSRLTRDDVFVLGELQRLREQLAKA